MVKPIRYRYPLGEDILELYGVDLNKLKLPSWIKKLIKYILGKEFFLSIRYYCTEYQCQTDSTCRRMTKPAVVIGNSHWKRAYSLSFKGGHISIEGTFSTLASHRQQNEIVKCESNNCKDDLDKLIISVLASADTKFEIKLDTGEFPDQEDVFFQQQSGNVKSDRVPTSSGPQSSNNESILYRFEAVRRLEFDHTFELTCDGVREEQVSASMESVTSRDISVITSPLQSISASPLQSGSTAKGCHVIVSILEISAINYNSSHDWIFDFETVSVDYSKSGRFNTSGIFVVTSQPDSDKIFDKIFYSKCDSGVSFDLSVIAERRNHPFKLGGGSTRIHIRCPASGTTRINRLTFTMVSGEQISVRIKTESKCIQVS